MDNQVPDAQFSYWAFFIPKITKKEVNPFPDDANTIGKCPRCGKPVIERSKGYFCTGRDCKFVLWRDSRFFTLKQKTLDKKTAALLLKKGAAPLKGCVSPKTGQVYDATVLLEDDGERPRFQLVFGHG